MIVAGTSSYVPDSVGNKLLKDDRLAGGRGHACRQRCLEELNTIREIPLSVRVRFVELFRGGCSAISLRDCAIRAGEVAFTCLEWKMFVPLSKYPWSLTCGDVDMHLERLKTEPGIKDITTRKFEALDELGYDRNLLKVGLRLLASVGFTTNPWEQGHGSWLGSVRCAELISTLCP